MRVDIGLGEIHDVVKGFVTPKNRSGALSGSMGLMQVSVQFPGISGTITGPPELQRLEK
jgi:hypothetical protein